MAVMKIQQIATGPLWQRHHKPKKFVAIDESMTAIGQSHHRRIRIELTESDAEILPAGIFFHAHSERKIFCAIGACVKWRVARRYTGKSRGSVGDSPTLVGPDELQTRQTPARQHIENQHAIDIDAMHPGTLCRALSYQDASIRIVPGVWRVARV